MMNMIYRRYACTTLLVERHAFVHETRVADGIGLFIDGIYIVDGNAGVDIGDGIDMYRTVYCTLEGVDAMSKIVRAVVVVAR
jgi:hypothetical protein